MEYTPEQKQSYINSLKARKCPWCNSYLNVFPYYTKCSRYFNKFCSFQIETAKYNEITK